ncbi:hypothetical protein AS026_05155 [Rhizobium altiplani]|uniref:Uncharacterized protein n=2 Tax=Rhizobium TaxID=379 RepID=K0Q4Z9_9HYPH|nr:hypothetical protein AS026_05155 [Rhizobium altiplani]CCM79717.1 hypothetical protein BN77_p40085 [Rhizobium mesoamericanum STM3625]
MTTFGIDFKEAANAAHRNSDGHAIGEPKQACSVRKTLIFGQSQSRAHNLETFNFHTFTLIYSNVI